jgi:hypothetical protein
MFFFHENIFHFFGAKKWSKKHAAGESVRRFSFVHRGSANVNSPLRLYESGSNRHVCLRPLFTKNRNEPFQGGENEETLSYIFKPLKGGAQCARGTEVCLGGRNRRAWWLIAHAFLVLLPLGQKNICRAQRSGGMYPLPAGE